MLIDGRERIVQTKIDGIAIDEDDNSTVAYLLCGIYRPSNRVFSTKEEAKNALYILQK